MSQAKPQPRNLDFSNQDLRNRSFKGQDLSGADFSGSDIRVCNFRGATLIEANFERATTGQSHKQVLIQIVFTFASAFLASCFIVAHLSGAIPVYTDLGSAGVFATATAMVVGFTFVIVFRFHTGEASIFSCSFGANIIFLMAYFIANVIDSISAFTRSSTFIGIFLSLVAIILLGIGVIYSSWFLRTIRRATGTSFRGANLWGARFNSSILHNTNFSGVMIGQVDWSNVQFLRNSFQVNEVFRMHISRNGKEKDYSYQNLQFEYLVGVDLTRANLDLANLSRANLRQTILERANLTGVQALGTDFTDAVLTGACIKNWSINAETIFTNVRCDYIYLEPGEQERKPSSGIFQPGDFEKLVAQFTKTLDFLFHNGIEPQAFDFALKNLLENYGDMEISINSILNVGDGDRLVRLDVSNPNADKSAMHQRFVKDYKSMQKQLQDARDKMSSLQQQLANIEGQLIVYKEQSAYLRAFTYHQTDQFSRPGIYASHAHLSGDLMPDKSNRIQFGNVQGDVGGVAGGDISGTVTNTIGQLEASHEPEALQLADLLKQLQAAITREDSGLSQKDQEKALKYIDILGKLGNDRQNPDLLEKAEAALDALPTIAKQGAGLIEFAEKNLPTITSTVRAILGL